MQVTDGYRLVYDLSQVTAAQPNWAWLLFPLAPIAVVVLLPAHMVSRGPRSRWLRLAFGVVFMAIWAWFHLDQIGGQNHQLRDLRAQAHRATAMEGCLQGFHAMPAGGHDHERIVLNGRCLAYTDFTSGAGFHQSESHGGPVHADSRVRLSQVDGVITRLEVIDHACPAAAQPPASVQQSCVPGFIPLS
jgi:hypothetical protein